MDEKPDKIVESHAFPLKTIFSDKYEVDFYQREYVWQHKQIEDLINDLSLEFLKNYHPGDAAEKVREYDPYFMGELVVSTTKGINFVIDGQQRITTFTLLLIYIKNKFAHVPNLPNLEPYICATSFGEKTFNLKVEERQACMEAIYANTDYIPEESASASVQNLLDRYSDIGACWNPDIDNEKIVNFTWWLIEKVIFSRVKTNSDEFAYVIFETMNDRGLSLTQVEMLRSFLLANIDRGEKRDAAMKKYDGMVKSLMDINLGSKSKAEFEFFKVFLRSHYAEGSMSGKVSDSDFARIGQQFHRWTSKNLDKLNLNTSDDYVDFIDRLKYFSKIYIKIQDIIKNRQTNNFLYVVVNSDYNFTLQPALIIAAIKYEDSDEIVEEKIKIISKYITKVLTWRVWGHWMISQSAMENQVYDLCARIRDIEDLDELRRILSTSPITVPEPKDFDTNSPTLNQQNKPRLTVMLSLITEIIARGCQEPNYMLKPGHPIEIEHIWSNHFEQHREEFNSEQDFQTARNNIGDLLVLPKGSNASYNDNPYSKETWDEGNLEGHYKIDHYYKENILAQSLNHKAYIAGSGFSNFQRLCGESHLPFKAYSKFTKDSISERANLYRDILKWNFQD